MPSVPVGSGFEVIDLFLKLWPEYVENGVFEAFGYVASAVEDDAKSTDTYQNVTGATRASTVAFAHDAVQLPEIAFEAVAVANNLNPGHADDDSLPPLDGMNIGELALTVMTATDYSYWLNIRNGGESMYLEAAIANNIDLIMKEVVEYIDLEVSELAKITRPLSPKKP